MKNNSLYTLSTKQLFVIHGTAMTQFKGYAKEKLNTFMENGVKAMDAVQGSVIHQLPLVYAPAKGSTLNPLDVTNTSYEYSEPKKPLTARLIDKIKKTFG